MLTSVIIPHYELHDLLKTLCLPPLMLFTNDFETIIVDNGSQKPLKLSAPATVVRSKVRLSFAAACNLGASKAKGDVLIFLNNDCQVLPGWQKHLLDALREEQTAVCGAKLLSGDGTIQHKGIAFGKKRVPYHPHFGEKENSKETGTLDVLAVTGALIAAKCSFFEEVGGFSEDFPGGNYEDVDFCLQAKKAGYKVKVALCSKAIHLGGASYQIHPEEHVNLLVRRNFEILRERWKNKDDNFFGITKKTPLLPREKEWAL